VNKETKTSATTKQINVPLSQRSTQRQWIFDGANQVTDFLTRVHRGILAVLWTGVALAGAPLVRGQDATSTNLPEHFDAGEAVAAPNLKKKKAKSDRGISPAVSDESLPPRSDETSGADEPATAAPSPKRKNVELAPQVSSTAPPQTAAASTEHLHRAEEPARSVPRLEKKTRVKRHIPPPAQPESSSSPVPTSMSLSVAQSMADSAPLPEYPYQARHANITGSGICVMIVDPTSGKVTNAMMAESTGNAILDKVTTDTFHRWRFKPGTVSQVRVPISYE
jgi:TonB family protein